MIWNRNSKRNQKCSFSKKATSTKLWPSFPVALTFPCTIPRTTLFLLDVLDNSYCDFVSTFKSNFMILHEKNDWWIANAKIKHYSSGSRVTAYIVKKNRKNQTDWLLNFQLHHRLSKFELPVVGNLKHIFELFGLYTTCFLI